MLTFFRRIRKALLGSGQARKPASSPVPSGTEGKVERYLLYAIGEIALVVIGILIALQINNWNEDRKTHQKEQDLLYQIRNNLEYNIRQLSDAHNELQSKQNSIETVVINITLKKKLSNIESTHFYGAFSPRKVSLSSSAYETLKSVGLDLVENDELRDAIVNLYDISYPYLQNSIQNTFDNWEIQMIVPYYSKNFSFEVDRLIPNNYESLFGDQEFLNLQTARQTYFIHVIETLENLIKATTEVISEIDKHLGRI